MNKILVVDDLATNRILLRARLGAASYDVQTAANPAQAVALAAETGFDLIVIGAALPGSEAMALCRRLCAGGPGQNRAATLLLVPARDPELVQAGFAAGADAVLARPLSEPLLLARIRALLGRQAAEAAMGRRAEACHAAGLSPLAAEPLRRMPKIALVGEFTLPALKLRGLLAPQLNAEYTLLTPQAALAGAAGAEGPDLYLLSPEILPPAPRPPGEPERGRHRLACQPEAARSASHPGGVDQSQGALRSGNPAQNSIAQSNLAQGNMAPVLALLAELHARSNRRRAEVCLHLPLPDPVAEALALDLGAGEVMSGTALRDEARPRLTALLARKARGDSLVNSFENGLRAVGLDALTGLRDRRSGLARLGRMLGALPEEHPAGAETGVAARLAGSSPLAVLLLDLDRFKSINDRYGHAAGDAVLIEVAARLRAALGPGDLLARIGGEEFLVGLPSAPLAQARAIAEDLRRRVERAPVVLPEVPQGLHVTLSLGLALAEPGSRAPEGMEALLRQADAALFTAKRSGRNRVECAPLALAHPV